MPISTTVSLPTQLSMPGMPITRSTAYPNATWNSVNRGVEVLYLGKINGGPRHGSSGIVKHALRRKAIVDMGHFGTWHIPYCLLAIPEAA